MRITKKQAEILKTIRRRNPDGSMIDLDQLIERLSWKPSKQSFQHSLRALVNNELVEKKGFELRRNAKRRILNLTFKGYEATKSLSD